MRLFGNYNSYYIKNYNYLFFQIPTFQNFNKNYNCLYINSYKKCLIFEVQKPHLITEHSHNKFRDEIKGDENDIIIDILKGYAHPKGGVIFYKIKYKDKIVVYASDTEGYLWGDQKLIEFAKECDVLIHDAQFTSKEYKGRNFSSKQGYGHSTPEMAINVAKEAKVKRLILFHHDPEHTDKQIQYIEKACQQLFPNSQAAYEGLEIDLL